MLRIFAATIWKPYALGGEGGTFLLKPAENYFWLTEEKVNLELCLDLLSKLIMIEYCLTSIIREKKDNKVKMDSLNKKNRKKKMLCFKNRDDFNFLRQKQKYQKRCKG